MTGRPTTALVPLEALVASIGPLDGEAMATTARRLDALTKPPGSLGRLERLAVSLAGIVGHTVTGIEQPAIAVFAADHGVTARGVSPYPSEVTRQMLANFASGGAAINVLARSSSIDLVVVDVGIAVPEPDEGRAARQGHAVPPAGSRVSVVVDRVAAGTRDLSTGPAMTRRETLEALAAGRRIANDLVAAGCDLLGVGEMGIGNTTASSAIVAAMTGRPAAEVTGRGTGLDDPGVARKTAVVAEALELHRPDPADPLGVLAAVGGLEIAALVGAILEAAAARVPVVLDGYITGAAALVASAMAPRLPGRLIAAHRSAEPGHRVVLERLGLEPVLDLDLRLGEGSGAALAIPIVRSAAAIVGEMATFDDAGVSNRP